MKDGIYPFDRYETALAPERRAFDESGPVRRLFDEDADARFLHGFLIHFTAFGVHMTEPVERWIAAAGRRCMELGFAALGESLVRHAGSEAGHHEMMIADARHLAARWRERQGAPFEVERILAGPPPVSAHRYRALHEEVIASDTPWRQLAIEYEIEALSVRLGPRLMDRCRARLDREDLAGLTFLREHVTQDVGHTLFNRGRMAETLGSRPDMVPPMIDAGCQALRAYLAFVADCVAATESVVHGAAV